MIVSLRTVLYLLRVGGESRWRTVGGGPMWAHSRVASDDSQCAICGCENPNVLQQHHRIPSRFGGTDREENLVVLCSNCHAVIERIYNEAFWERIQSLTFDEVQPDSDRHIQNLRPFDSAQTDGEKPQQSEAGEGGEERDLAALAREIVQDGRVAEFETARGTVDKELLKWKFEIETSDAKILKKLISRERSKNLHQNEIPKERRNEIIYRLSKKDISQKEIADVFDLTQASISKICINREKAADGSGGRK